MTASMRQQTDAAAAPRVREPNRQEFAERLLKGSVKKSYAPVVDIDWDAPLDPDKFFLPPRCVSLYDTPMWDEMTREQQIELSRQELVNTLSAGIWFENMLNQALLRKMIHQDPTARATHYALTELGVLYEKMNLPERSLVLYERALVEDPNQFEVRERVEKLKARGIDKPLPLQ